MCPEGGDNALEHVNILFKSNDTRHEKESSKFLVKKRSCHFAMGNHEKVFGDEH